MACTILLTEDDPSIRRFIRVALEWNGYHVLRARNGEEALRIARVHQGPIHLLLADVVMPRKDGFSLADEIAPWRPETRVLYVSGHAEDSSFVRDGLRASGAAYLLKPFTCDALIARIEECLKT